MSALYKVLTSESGELFKGLSHRPCLQPAVLGRRTLLSNDARNVFRTTNKMLTVGQRDKSRINYLSLLREE
jgi:hypothetical protein